MQRQLAAVASADKVDMTIDAHLLLGKLHYALGSTRTPLLNLSRAGLDTLSKRQLPMRGSAWWLSRTPSKACVGESALASSSKSRRRSVRGDHHRVVRAGQRHGAARHLQEVDKERLMMQSTWSVPAARPAPLPPHPERVASWTSILETAQKAPILIQGQPDACAPSSVTA